MNKIKLGGGAIDTLVKLFKFGPQESGDIPSKAGFSELVEHELATVDYDKPKSHSLTKAGCDQALFYQK